MPNIGGPGLSAQTFVFDSSDQVPDINNLIGNILGGLNIPFPPGGNGGSSRSFSYTINTDDLNNGNNNNNNGRR
jgi:hypothetical protein